MFATFKRVLFLFVCLAAMLLARTAPAAGDLMDRVEHGYADHDGVKIHYASIGEGPLIVFIHGFPDFWYSWKHQMETLSDEYRCVAVDQRGYNKSDQPDPSNPDNYKMELLVGDVVAVIKSLGEEKAIVVGHDWGGMVAWQTALAVPELVDKLVICNLPHPRGLARVLATNDTQKLNSSYARNFQQEGFYKNLNPAMLAGMVARGDEEKRARYQTAFEASSLEAMLDYYRANYPRTPYVRDTSPVVKLQMPVLQFHGLGDTVLLAGALNDTWEWMDRDFTLVTLPGVGHWVQHEAAETVSQTMKWWLAMRK